MFFTSKNLIMHGKDTGREKYFSKGFAQSSEKSIATGHQKSRKKNSILRT